MIHLASMTTEGKGSDKSEALSQTGTGTIVEGGEVGEVDVKAEKHHVKVKDSNTRPNGLHPGKIQACDWSVSLKNMPKFSEVQLNEKLKLTNKFRNF